MTIGERIKQVAGAVLDAALEPKVYKCLGSAATHGFTYEFGVYYLLSPSDPMAVSAAMEEVSDPAELAWAKRAIAQRAAEQAESERMQDALARRIQIEQIEAQERADAERERQREEREAPLMARIAERFGLSLKV